MGALPGVGVNLLHKKPVFDWISRHMVCAVPNAVRRIALTFDDGPNPRVTPRLLDLLDHHEVRATFFLIGRHVERHPRLAAEIARRGHEIGNHTHNHLGLPLLPRRWQLRELERAGQRIQHATGVRPYLYRPPMGWFNRRMLRSLAGRGYRAILGDVHPQDSRRPGVGAIARCVLDRVRSGSIVILHDGGMRSGADRHQSVDAAHAVIPALKARRYQIGTVGQLLEHAPSPAASDTPYAPSR